MQTQFLCLCKAENSCCDVVSDEDRSQACHCEAQLNKNTRLQTTCEHFSLQETLSKLAHTEEAQYHNDRLSSYVLFCMP